jgi:hypothetical protein
MGSIAASGCPVSLVAKARGLASGGLAAVAVMVKAQPDPLEGPIVQVATVGGGVAAILL